MARYEPVCVENNSEEQFLDSNSDDKTWDKLEEYWSKERQTLDKISHSISCKLAKHLMCEQYADDTEKKEPEVSYSKMVLGADVNDIPTTYNTAGFKSHELIVIGTYIDKNTIPGFKYKVRKNLTNEYLFHGQALTLESVGLGYGKRLTFSGSNLNNNKNYFWSDSHPHGFGLTFQAITPNSIFRIMDLQSNIDIGRIVVNDPARSVDAEISTEVKEFGLVEKITKVHFSGDLVLNVSNHKQKTFYEDLDIRGIAIVQRVDKFSKAVIKEIRLENFIVDGCIMVPEE